MPQRQAEAIHDVDHSVALLQRDELSRIRNLHHEAMGQRQPQTSPGQVLPCTALNSTVHAKNGLVAHLLLAMHVRPVTLICAKSSRCQCKTVRHKDSCGALMSAPE